MRTLKSIYQYSRGSYSLCNGRIFCSSYTGFLKIKRIFGENYSVSIPVSYSEMWTSLNLGIYNIYVLGPKHSECGSLRQVNAIIKDILE